MLQAYSRKRARGPKPGEVPFAPARAMKRFSKSLKMYRGPKSFGRYDGTHEILRTTCVNFLLGIEPNGWQPLGVTTISGTATGIGLTFGFGTQNLWFYFSGYGTTTQTGVANVAIDGMTDIALLFDQIMLDRVSVEILFANTGAGEGQGATAYNYSAPIMASCIDYDDSGNNTVFGIEQYSTARNTTLDVLRPNWKQSLKPKFEVASFIGNGGTAQQTTLKRGYVNSSYDVIHRGIKTCLINQPVSYTAASVIIIKTYFLCKNPN